MRKRFAVALVLGLLLAAGSALAGEKPSLAGKRTMFLGDSITAAGQYVSFIEYELQKRFPDLAFDIISIGVSSETASGLSEKSHPFPRPCVHERLQRALDKVKPDVVVACYGMNDGIYHPQSDERMQAYQGGINKLIAGSKAAGSKVVLLTPPPFDPLPVRAKLQQDGAADYRGMRPYCRYHAVLEDYSRWIMSLKLQDVIAADLNTPMTRYLHQQRRSNPGYSFSGDGIHPNSVGHLLMAHQFLKAVGVPVEEGPLPQQVARIKADKLFGLVAQRRRLRSKGWTEYVGYTRGRTFKRDSVEAVEKKAAELQQQIDRARRKSVNTPEPTAPNREANTPHRPAVRVPGSADQRTEKEEFDYVTR